MSGPVAGQITHGTKVRALYKALLKLHRGLPFHLKAIGNEYVREEFKRHKSANKTETETFMEEWTKYYVTLAKQLASKHPANTLGQNLSPQMLENFREEQLGQLFELHTETQKPAADKPR